MFREGESREGGSEGGKGRKEKWDRGGVGHEARGDEPTLHLTNSTLGKHVSYVTGKEIDGR